MFVIECSDVFFYAPHFSAKPTTTQRQKKKTRMATTGDINRSYGPSGDGRDIHYFISKGATIPHTSMRIDPWHTPKLKSGGSQDRIRTNPAPRYEADGSGRDAFKDVGSPPPRTGMHFNPHHAPASDGRAGLGYKGFHYPGGLRGGYTPNGTGRDLQVFVDSPEVSKAPLPRTGFQYSEQPPHIKRYQQPVAAQRTEGPIRTFANGTGRDMYLLAVGDNIRAAKIPHTASQFSKVAPSPQKVPAHGLKPVAMATSPPPKVRENKMSCSS